jgi:hypothetical protein
MEKFDIGHWRAPADLGGKRRKVAAFQVTPVIFAEDRFASDSISRVLPARFFNWQ